MDSPIRLESVRKNDDVYNELQILIDKNGGDYQKLFSDDENKLYPLNLSGKLTGSHLARYELKRILLIHTKKDVGSSLKSISITNDSSGKPQINGMFENFKISLSHSKNHIAVMAVRDE